MKNNNYIKKSSIKILGGGGDRDINGYIYKGKNSFNFENKEDEKIIKDTLEKLELEKDTKFICLTVRDNTERPVTIQNGTNKLIGTDYKNLINEATIAICRKLKENKILFEE